jgi:hypothetical protein
MPDGWIDAGGLNVFAAHPFVVFGLSASSTV